jgi:hypothetical protein
VVLILAISGYNWLPNRFDEGHFGLKLPVLPLCRNTCRDPCGRARRSRMSGAYPHFKLSYTHEELVEHFLLTPADLQLVWTCRGETNL